MLANIRHSLIFFCCFQTVATCTVKTEKSQFSPAKEKGITVTVAAAVKEILWTSYAVAFLIRLTGASLYSNFWPFSSFGLWTACWFGKS